MTPNPLSDVLTIAIDHRVKSLLDAHKAGTPLPEPIDYFTDNFAQTVEKLIIETVRAWQIEDQIGEAFRRGDDASVVELKRKLETCWKIVRPRLLAAINRQIDNSLIHGRSLVEDSVKLYKGYDDAPKHYAPEEFTKEERGDVVEERIEALERRCDTNGIYE